MKISNNDFLEILSLKGDFHDSDIISVFFDYPNSLLVVTIGDINANEIHKKDALNNAKFTFYDIKMIEMSGKFSDGRMIYGITGEKSSFGISAKLSFRNGGIFGFTFNKVWIHYF